MNTDEIRSWIVDRIAEALDIAPEDIDVNARFTDHGLDSVSALQLTGALEQRLGRSLSATVVFEYPTIETLARHLGASGS
jgi:acyl carrier protein